MTAARMRDAERTRQLLLEAAERLFAERGVDGTSTDDIARASGVNKAMINYHFGGKDGLYSAIVVDLLETALTELETLPASSLPGEAKLREFLRIFARTHSSRSTVSAMIVRELLSGGGRMEEQFRARFLRILRVLTEVLAQGAREGSFRQVTTIEAHIAMMGALTFFFVTRPFRERLWEEGKLPVSPITPEHYTAFLEELITRGLAPDAALVRGDVPAALPPTLATKKPRSQTNSRSSRSGTASKGTARSETASPGASAARKPARSTTKTASRRRTSS